MLLKLVAVLLVLSTAAAPTIVPEESTAKYERVNIVHGGGHVEGWALLVLTLKFTEDLYAMYNGTRTRIDQIPYTPPVNTFNHPHDPSNSEIPFYAWPLNQILGGAFRVSAATDPATDTSSTTTTRRRRAAEKKTSTKKHGGASAKPARRRRTQSGGDCDEIPEICDQCAPFIYCITAPDASCAEAPDYCEQGACDDYITCFDESFDPEDLPDFDEEDVPDEWKEQLAYCDGFDTGSMWASHINLFRNYGEESGRWPEVCLPT